MTTNIELSEYLGSRPQREAGLRLPLPRFLRLAIRNWQERRALVRLSRLSPHLVRDMGFDPESIYDALEGSWDELKPGQFRNR